MAVFVELTTDAFEDVFQQQRENKHTTGRAGRSVVRRPHRGLEIKEDTYAFLKVVRANGEELPLIDSSSPDGFTSSGYANFILQSVQEQRMEKHQIVETFGESYIFFFGEAPRFLQVQAVLLNSHDFNWEAEWWENYNRYLRGTKLVEMGARMFLFYDDNIVEGYMMMAQASKSSTEPFLIQLNFQVFLTNHSNISFIGDPNFPIRSSVELPEGVELTQPGSSVAIQDQIARDALALQESGFGPNARISDMLRRTSPTLDISPDVWTQISRLDPVQAEPLFNLLSRLNKPLRGLIAENIDEYTGVPESKLANPFVEKGGVRSALTPMVRDVYESEDLFRDSIQFLACYGAMLDSPAGLISIGLGPKFSSDGKPTFKPLPGVPFGFGVTQAEGLPSASDYNGFVGDALGAVFGSKDQPSGFKDPRYTEGAGDPFYGYPSDFATDPGFGQTGFGDFGGLGFGSGLGPQGDPGFKDPEKFTFAGVANEQSAFERFLEVKEDPTAFGGLSLTAGPGGVDGVALIPGAPSAFSLVSLPGVLSPEGEARQKAEAISEKQAAQKFGFGLSNPYGISCPATGFGFSESFSEGTGGGKTFSFP